MLPRSSAGRVGWAEIAGISLLHFAVDEDLLRGRRLNLELLVCLLVCFLREQF